MDFSTLIFTTFLILEDSAGWPWPYFEWSFAVLQKLSSHFTAKIKFALRTIVEHSKNRFEKADRTARKIKIVWSIFIFKEKNFLLLKICEVCLCFCFVVSILSDMAKNAKVATISRLCVLRCTSRLRDWFSLQSRLNTLLVERSLS